MNTSTLFDLQKLVVFSQDDRLSSQNEYQLKDEQENLVGYVECSVKLWHMRLSYLLPRQFIPYTMLITDSEKNLLVKVARNWTMFFLQRIDVFDQENVFLGHFEYTLKPSMNRFFNIYDAENKYIGYAEYAFGSWEATLYAEDKTPLMSCVADKEYSKEAKYGAGKFTVSLLKEVENASIRKLLTAVAITGKKFIVDTLETIHS